MPRSIEHAPLPADIPAAVDELTAQRDALDERTAAGAARRRALDGHIQQLRQMAALDAEREQLNERIAIDARARTPENYRRRDALDRRLRRWRVKLPASTPRQGGLGHDVPANTAVHRANSGDISVPGVGVAAPPIAGTRGVCAAPGCDRPVPEYRGGRKVRTDAETCGRPGCKKALTRARQRATS